MFTFSKYDLRPIAESDREHLTAAIARDRQHRDTVTPEFFLKPEAGMESMVLVSHDETMFYFMMERALRLHIQFCVTSDAEKNKQAMSDGFLWLREMAKANGFRQLIFDSKFPPLIRFCERFGFKPSPDGLVCNLGSPVKSCEVSTNVPAPELEHGICVR
jgi:hypothetical protein